MRQVKTKAASATSGLLFLIVPVAAAGIGLAAAAAVILGREGASASALAGWLALLSAATLAEAFPLPLGGIPLGATSLASVFLIGAASIYDWTAAAVLAFVTQAVVGAWRRRPPARLAYNTAVYALAAGAAGLVVGIVERSPLDRVAIEVPLAAAAFYAVDLALISLVVARWTREPFGTLLRRTLRSTTVPLAIMASLSVILVVLWERSPVLAVALFGPLVALDLYQRSTLRTLEAMRSALTDPVTGLGNRRRFEERLGQELAAARVDAPVSVCLVDVDGLKQVNDDYGHPVGDRLLVAVGSRLAAGGEAFRLGGDEFALLLPGLDAHEARPVVEVLLVDLGLEGIAAAVEASAGIATYPRHAVTVGELVEHADQALYWSKKHARGSVSVYVGEGRAPRPATLTDAPEDRAARLQAAASLAHAVDARSPRAGRHSEAVALVAGRIAARLGIDAEQRELIQLAGRVHDLGKLAIPEQILEKPALLDSDEQRVLQRHPAIGFRMLAALGLESIAEWVLHHHERWDGAGYPDGLAADAIPLGSRIIAVADAFDAMTAEQAHRSPSSEAAALDELTRHAGAQFDPAVVAALAAELRDEKLAS